MYLKHLKIYCSEQLAVPWLFGKYNGNGRKNISGHNLSVRHNSIVSIFGGVSLRPLIQNKCGTLGVRYKLANNDVRNFLENMSAILANLNTLI